MMLQRERRYSLIRSDSYTVAVSWRVDRIIHMYPLWSRKHYHILKSNKILDCKVTTVITSLNY